MLVDEGDAPLGREDRAAAHRGDGRLHRAFNLLLVDETGRLLLARRAPRKPLWPGCWDGTLASHPVEGETYADAAARRLDQELLRRGLVPAAPRPLVRFRYQARDGDRGSEHELCTALLQQLPTDDVLAPVEQEIDALRWVTPEAFVELADTAPAALCPWLLLTLRLLADDVGDVVDVVDVVDAADSADAAGWRATAVGDAAARALAAHDLGLDPRRG